ncbi:helix-turn-helix domain-containing protein [Bacillus sp. T33-2]|uniref:helix-turn-helix domain-containing protein n=1 Tax=Bacillus sp. T33-2 TaxID=2054168 RepID=UPI000C75E42E|nr:helix-turn-helix transcriptional regulator [Bacillus sp. T33-2]PLR91108.1 transcriptional regulator [Bacillus sp. T33-2]
MIAQRLRLARKAKLLTQEQLATLVNTKKTTISNYETGYSSPSNEMLNDLADALEVSTDYLLGRTAHPDGSTDQSRVSKQHQGIEELMRDPEFGLWYRELKGAPDEIKEEAFRFLKYLKEQKKDRKPGNKK